MSVLLKFHDEHFFGKLLEVEQNVSLGNQRIVLRFESILDSFSTVFRLGFHPWYINYELTQWLNLNSGPSF